MSCANIILTSVFIYSYVYLLHYLFHLLTYLLDFLFSYLSIFLFICSFIYLLLHFSIHLFNCLIICFFISLLIYLSGRYQDLDRMGDFDDLVQKYQGGRKIPPEKINLLRLILTWTSEGNVIKQKKKAPVPPHSCNTVTFGQELTEKHLIPLFPKSGS